MVARWRKWPVGEGRVGARVMDLEVEVTGDLVRDGRREERRRVASSRREDMAKESESESVLGF